MVRTARNEGQDPQDPVDQLAVEGQAMVEFAQALRGIPTQIALRVVDHFRVMLGENVEPPRNGHVRGRNRSAVTRAVRGAGLRATERTRSRAEREAEAKAAAAKAKNAAYQREYRAAKKAEKEAALLARKTKKRTGGKKRGGVRSGPPKTEKKETE